MTELIDAPTEPTKTANAPAPVSEPTGWMGDTGDFRDGAPEAVQKLMEAKKWTNVEQMAIGYAELERFKGAGEHLVIPEAEDAQGWDNIYKQLGRPETHDKYEFVNESGIELSNELMDGFKQFAHKEGYTQKQLSGAIQFQLDAVKASEELQRVQSQEREESNVHAMKAKWGEAKYDEIYRNVEATAEKLQVLEYFRELGIDKDPEIVNMLITISNSDREDALNPSPPAPPQVSPLEELVELKRSDAFLQKFHPDHRACMTRFMELNQSVVQAGQGKAPR